MEALFRTLALDRSSATDGATAVLSESLPRILKAEYLRSGGRGQTGVSNEALETALPGLLAMCQPAYRVINGDDAMIRRRPWYEADGAKLVYFLASKGHDAGGQQ
jgi:hypothetical protein